MALCDEGFVDLGRRTGKILPPLAFVAVHLLVVISHLGNLCWASCPLFEDPASFDLCLVVIANCESPYKISGGY